MIFSSEISYGGGYSDYMIAAIEALALVLEQLSAVESAPGLAASGKLVVVGASDEPIEAPPFLMILERRSLVGWPSGISIDSQDTLSFSVNSGVRSRNEVFPLERAAEAYDHAMSGKASLDVYIQLVIRRS
jgi:D-arabinose 1-dehydrogenase-like Zn-dependent alcohol dehydrogenase